jgi:hypothetical protein
LEFWPLFSGGFGVKMREGEVTVVVNDEFVGMVVIVVDT